MLPALAVTNSSPNPLWKKTASTSRFALCATRSTPAPKKSSTPPVAWTNSTTNSAICSNANRRFAEIKKTAFYAVFFYFICCLKIHFRQFKTQILPFRRPPAESLLNYTKIRLHPQNYAHLHPTRPAPTRQNP